MGFIIYTFFAILLSILSVLSAKYSIGSLEYPLFFLFLIVSLVYVMKFKIRLVKSYRRLFLIYVFLMLVNTMLSKYSPSLPYSVIGAVITILPFLLFIVSYNYKFTFTQINKFIDIWIYMILIFLFIAYAETFVFNTAITGSAIVSISVLKFGFFASMCNQALLLSLFKYSISKQRRYKYI